MTKREAKHDILAVLCKTSKQASIVITFVNSNDLEENPGLHAYPFQIVAVQRDEKISGRQPFF